VLDGPRSLVWPHLANQIPVTAALVHSLLSATSPADLAADSLPCD
jgi:hypothetical protein